MKPLLLILALLSATYPVLAQPDSSVEQYWNITNRHSIVWDLTKEDKLPHADNIEMAGKNVAAIVYYSVDSTKAVTIEKDVIFPQLRTFNKTNEPDWKKYRAYFRERSGHPVAPSISYQNKTIVATQVDSIEIGGMLTFYYAPVNGLQIRKKIYPSMEQRLLVEEWQVKNIDAKPKEIAIANVNYQRSENGYKGIYSFIVQSDAPKSISIAAEKTISFPVYYGATLNDESTNDFNAQRAHSSRMTFLKTCRENLVLTTPDKTINMLFYFSKIRAAESIYNSSMGLVHSPGGGNYYVGIWANDQVEYSGPFLPYLGYPTANEAAFNTYNKFLQNIPKDDRHIPYAFEVDGNFAMTHLDRGDAAMIAYGTSQYLLASGNVEEAKELWPLIEWSLDYCHRNRNAAGAVESASDEMEGRIETGTANLSTSTLYYGGLAQAAQIAAALGKPNLAATYRSRHVEMYEVIESYFGSVINRLKTYRYYDGNTTLRHWICLPLVMGITERKNVTLDALFNRLWTDNGILVEYYPGINKSKAIFWDRATLYALRGALTVGETELALARLKQYSQKRLLGDHVPYAIEAWPENNMRHLSAESALYARIFIEGMLGIKPIDFETVSINPKLPRSWGSLSLNQVYIYGKPVDINIVREWKGLRITVTSGEKIIFDGIQKNGALEIMP